MRKEFMEGSEILVACEKVSTEAEVTGIKRNYNSLDYNPLSSTPGTGNRSGWGLRMIRSGKLGVSGEWGMIDPFRLVEKAIGSCRYGSESLFSFPANSPEPQDSIPGDMHAITHDSVQDYLIALQRKIREIHPLAALSARIQWGKDSFAILNSRGFSGFYSKTTTSSSFSVTLPGDNGLIQSGYSLNTTDSLPVMNDVLDMLSLHIHSGEQSTHTKAGKRNVVLSPAAFSILLQAVRTGISGKLLAEGSSPLAEMEDKQVLSKLLTIRDLPRLTTGAASAPFDSEGIPTRDKTLFEDGVFKCFLHDLRTAAECNTESTGSSGRNLGEHSKPVCTNLSVDPSITGSVNTLPETGSGILVTNILSAGGGNATSGSFTLDCGRVYLFRRGEIQGYNDGCILTGNVYDALLRVNAVGNRQYRIGSDLLPFVSLDGISVR